MSLLSERGASGPPPSASASGTGPGRVPWILVGLALIVIGAGAWLIAGSHNGKHRSALYGGLLPVNAGALNPLDLRAQNTPIIAQNPLDPGNVVLVAKVDSPTYSCSVFTSFDGGGHWSQTPLPAPAGEQPLCYAPDAAF